MREIERVVAESARVKAKRRGDSAADSKTTIAKIAADILRERGGPMHFRDIAKAAAERGYVGNARDFDATAHSFRRTMQRLAPRFKPVGDGNFALQ